MSAYRLLFLGSGSAFTVGHDNFHSNMLLTHLKTKEHFLIDCGSDCRHALHVMGLSYQDITHVYISHLHADHAGGLEWLALSRYFDHHCTKPHLYANKSILNLLWPHTLSGGLSTLQNQNATLETYFDFTPIAADSSFTWQDIDFQLVQTIHIFSGASLMPSYGLLLNLKKMCVFITTDTQWVPNQLLPFYKKADIIFQDCEISSCPSGVHATFDDLTALPLEIKQKMWLYHYDSDTFPDALSHGFKGFVKRGQTFDLE